MTMRTEGNSHLYRLRGETLRALSRELLTGARLGTIVGDVTPDGWERKVLRDFVTGEAIQIPASRKKREVVLRWLARRFEPGVRYPEREVDRILGLQNDFFTLRRELIGYGLLARQKGVYWRPEVEPRKQG